MIKIFTEAGRTVGLGHLTRMRSLKNQLVTDGYEARLFVQVEDGESLCVVQTDCGEMARRWINDLEAMRLEVCQSDIVVIDTYKPTEEFMKEVSSLCEKVVAIDDYNRIRYENCAVVNPNFYGQFLDYPQVKNCEYYLGPSYNLVRPEFCAPRKRIIRESVQRILVTFGGTDILGLTHRVVPFCHGVAPKAGLDVVVTDSFSNLDEIENVLVAGDILHKNIDASHMCELMLQDDFTIASAGSTSNELMKTRCPSILIQVADNQSETIRYLEPLGYFRTFGADCFEKIEEMLKLSVREEIYANLMKLEVESSAKNLVEDIYDAYVGAVERFER